MCKLIPPPCLWQSPPSRLALADNEVHVWSVSLEQPSQIIQRLEPILSTDEQKRASSFKFDHLRRHFVVGRGVLRDILGRYLQIKPSQVQFRYGQYGKPALVEAAETSTRLEFNLSHSGPLALYAVTPTQPVGIDLEAIRPLTDMEEIAHRFFAPSEYKTLLALPDEQRLLAFFNGWTRKEAYIKALGTGLSHPLHTFKVSLVPGQPASLLDVEGDPQATGRWSVLAFTPAAGYVAALSIAQQGVQTHYYQWEFLEKSLNEFNI